MAIISVQNYLTPCGKLILGSVGENLCLCYWTFSRRYPKVCERLRLQFGGVLKEQSSDVLRQAVLQLDDYFSGNMKSFSLPLLVEGSDFQKQVWRQLCQIPYGATCTYQQLAEACRQPLAVRAIANVLGNNPLQIIQPCHRVVCKSGGWGGYAGGVSAKKYLLERESGLEPMFVRFCDL